MSERESRRVCWSSEPPVVTEQRDVHQGNIQRWIPLVMEARGIEPQGILMIAVQALEARTRELAELRQRLAALETALERLEAVTEANQR